VESVWQNFERLAAFMFEKNDFRVNVNTVKTLNKKRRQYDIIVRKNNQTFLIECKKWAGNRYRLSALKKAILQYKERTTFYGHITNEDAIPLIVTLIEEEIRVFEGVPLVPVLKLNAFMYEALKVYTEALGDDVQVKTLKFYIAFKRINNFACVEIFHQKNEIKVYLKIDPHTITLEKGFSRDVSNIGHWREPVIWNLS